MVEPISSVVSTVSNSGALSGPIQTLKDIWYLAVGHKYDQQVQEVRLKQQINLDKMRSSLENRVSNLPDGDIQEPSLSIVGPALEASKFYMDVDDIREMFAQLIASSMSKSKSSDIHPSFVEIIKMLSPLDARILSYVYSFDKQKPIVCIQNKFTNVNTYSSIYEHILIANDDVEAILDNIPSVENLMRLKLVDVSYAIYFTQNDVYEPYRNLPLLAELNSEAEQESLHFEKLKRILESGDPIGTQDGVMSEERKKVELEEITQRQRKVEIKKGVIKLTAFGSNFCKVCL